MDQSILRTPQNAHDGKGELLGLVKDAKGNPVSGVQVHVIDGNINDAITDNAGSYRTQYLAAGVYGVVYSKDGFVPVTNTINIADKSDSVNNVVIGS